MKLSTIFLSGSVFIVLLLNINIINKEINIAKSIEIKIALAPVDPRSLIQGDYMRLAYKIPPKLVDKTSQGQLKISIDSDGFVTDYALYHNEALEKDQHLLQFKRKKGDNIHIGSESFLFQEGKAKHYAKATHAIFYLTPSGETILKDLYVPLKRVKKVAKDNL